MKRYYLILLGVLLLFNSNFRLQAAENEPGSIYLNRQIQATVQQNMQKQVFIVPVDPLEFDSDLKWDLTINKKSLSSEKEPAYFLIETLDNPGKQIERRTISASGSLKIPKGVRYRVTLYAGDYSRLMFKSGAEVKVVMNYNEALVKYSLGDQPYQMFFEIQGPSGLDQWQWLWGGNEQSLGNKVSYAFKKAGETAIVIVGSGKTPSGINSEKFYFELNVPPLIVLNPEVGPLKGPAELKVAVKVSAKINYGQKAVYSWNFGNGIEVTGLEATNNFTNPGKYQLVLTAKINQITLEQNWLIVVTPLTINLNPAITPLSGPVPLAISGSLNPAIEGGPTRLKYVWEFAGKTIEDNSFQYTFTEPGDYQVVLKAIDSLHPDLVIPETIFIVTATAPQILIKPTVSIDKGIVPLTAVFNSNCEVKGSPADLNYHWDFGDGEFSYEANPTHVFQKPGQYQAHLVIHDRLHPGNLVEDSIAMTVQPPEMKATATANLTSGVVPLAVNFKAQVAITGSPCEPIYLWDFGDGQTSLEQNPVHVYHQEGQYTVTLEVKDRIHPGNSSKSSISLEAKTPKIKITAAVNPNSGSAPLTVQCRAWADEEGTNSPQFNYSWDFGDGALGDGTEVSHTFDKAGTYIIMVTVTEPNLGFTERKNVKVTVK